MILSTGTQPALSIVMPVFDTGRLLIDSVRSIVEQELFREEGAGSFELLIVDDASTDPLTIAALEEAAAITPSVRVMQNVRRKGVAGARNTGIAAARASWIGFLDSDDLWYPDFLARQRDAFAALPDAAWRAAHFDVGDADARARPLPLSARSPCLYRVIEDDYRADRVSILRRPVDTLLRCGCMQVMTVQVRRSLIEALGGFDETLVCAEDYDLWLRLANVQDLAIAPIDAGVYRTRAGSLTKAGKPMYFGEDRMLRALRANPAFAPSRPAIDDRLHRVYEKFCFDLRRMSRFAEAARVACRLIGMTPTDLNAWRQLGAALLRR